MVHWTTSNLIISNNIIGNADGYGIEIRPNQGGAQNIINNEIYGCKLHGLLVGQTNSNVKVAGNRCYENGMSGIRIAGDSGIDRNVFFEITGNSCWNNGNIVGGDSSGIFLSYTDSSLFSNNFCYDNQSSPTQAFGFQLSNCTATNLGFNNIGYGNSSGLFSLSGLIIPSGTGEIFTMSGQLLFNKVTPSDDELVNFYDTNFASVVIQSGGGSRWWIAADTSSLYNNKLLIGGAGNTTPIITDYPIVCNDAGGTTLTDSVQINKDGVWIRKMFWSITGDSLGIIGFNTVDGEIDTAWAVTK